LFPNLSLTLALKSKIAPHCTKTTKNDVKKQKNVFIAKNTEKCEIKLEYSASREHESNF
jgi:hypothetical protein